MNQLTMDYMQTPWLPGLKYGFACTITVPDVSPTGSANFFSIEFGYAQSTLANRIEAGTLQAPLVQRIINGGVSYTTSIAGYSTILTFSAELITPIPQDGSLTIIGPANFVFEAKCQPKPAPGYPELPYDSVCLATSDTSGIPTIDIVAGPSGIKAAMYQITLNAVNPPAPGPGGTWTIISYSIVSERLVLDQNTTLNGFQVATQMTAAYLVMHPNQSCVFNTPQAMALDATLPVSNCDFEYWQQWPPRGLRNDRPYASSQLIFLIQLAADVGALETMIIRAPLGYVFNPECGIVTFPSSLIFDATATNGVPQVDSASGVTLIPPGNQKKLGFTQRYTPWPSDVKVYSCLGHQNQAQLNLDPGLQTYQSYLFRLEVGQNPASTPDYNYFVVEYNGEASVPFPGIEIWAFNNCVITPLTTAASLPGNPTVNTVTIQLQPVNIIPNGGHLKITAPSGFVVPTQCSATVAIDPSEAPNVTGVGPGDTLNSILEWSLFLPGDIVCQGDVTPSSRASILFSGDKRFMNSNYTYIITLQLWNPETTTSVPDPWVFQSFAGVSELVYLDLATVPGFAVNAAVETFAYLTPTSVNALALQRLDFNLSFPETVAIGDSIVVVGPETMYFSMPGDSRCPGYVFLGGAMRNTVPTCGANTIQWFLSQESIPAASAVSFMTQVQNPPFSPEVNLFQVAHLASDGTFLSSRMIPGFAIVPQLTNPSVTEYSASFQCQPSVPIITGFPCLATSSSSAVQVTFTATQAASYVQLRAVVGTSSFDFSVAQFDASSQVVVTGRSIQAIAGTIQIYPNNQMTLKVYGFVNPSTTGQALWSITTFGSGQTTLSTTTTLLPPISCTVLGPCGVFPPVDQRKSEVLSLPTYQVLGYIGIQTTSNINPIFFGTTDATASFDVLFTYPVLKTHVVRITRPPGYSLQQSSLRTYEGLTVDQNGLDYMRRFSQVQANANNPEDYYMVLSSDLPANSLVKLTLQTALPTQAEQVTYWYFTSYYVMPLLDTDGEVLNASQVPYPWIGRNLTETGTNDGAFSGFLLVGQIPFKISPSLQTPGATITLTLECKIADGVEAQSYLRVELAGPIGYVFKDNCLAQGSSYFSKCTGFKNMASLASVQNTLRGTDILVYLGVTNPGETPNPNFWSLSLFQDTSSQYIRYSTLLGYAISGMGVVFAGNNQLGMPATGFFTFTPVRNSPTPVIRIQFIPPPGGGFVLQCSGVSPLGFVASPSCQSGAMNDPLMLMFNNASLTANFAYTIGIGILSPGGAPNPANNYWGVSLMDYAGNVFDANLRIPGLELQSIPLIANGLGWSTAAPNVMATVLIQFRVLHAIPGGTIAQFIIGAPDGIMYDQDASSVQVLPLPLPLLVATPSTVAGATLSLNLDQSQDIAPAVYNIRFQVSNPGVYPFANIWSLVAEKGVDIPYSNMFTGYMTGQASPFDVSVAVVVADSTCEHNLLLWPVLTITTALLHWIRETV